VRALGLDVGSKTIGVAVSDELGLLAHPRLTLARKGTRADAEAVAALVEKEGAGRVVVGLPLTLEGEVGPRARRVLVLVDALRARLAIPVDTWDERFSTAAAERALIELDVSRARRRAVIDAHAAAHILQGWLDARREGS
jgi:putative holliday junction resolvase